MSTGSLYVGIDVAKAELVAAFPTADLCRVTNTPDGFRQLIAHLATRSIAALVMESTGCYGRGAAVALIAAGYQVAIVQPGRVRSFAASIGVRAKTDPIDARVIARFGEATKPRSTALPADNIAKLRALIDRRDQIIDMRKQEENRQEGVTEPLILKDLRASVKKLVKSELAYAKKIADAIEQDVDMKRISDGLQKESGVGLQTAATLLAHFPELGHINRQQAAALAGLAPYDRSSGTSNGKRMIAGGRKRIRRALYMAAITASRWSPWIKDHYASLRSKGKCAKVALIACARKLLVRLNSIAAGILTSTEGQDPAVAS
jgi:transposase